MFHVGDQDGRLGSPRAFAVERHRLPDGSETPDFPAHQSDFHHARPVLETVPGWGEPLDACATVDDLPRPARDYVELVEQALGVPVELVGTGAAREQVLARG